MPKEKSIEERYQKKTPIEHILLRPDTYVGSNEHHQQQMWVYDATKDKMVYRNIDYVPGIYKIFGRRGGQIRSAGKMGASCVCGVGVVWCGVLWCGGADEILVNAADNVQRTHRPTRVRQSDALLCVVLDVLCVRC